MLRFFALVVAVTLAPQVAAGQEVEERVRYRAVTWFNLHLYSGAMRGPLAVACDSERDEIWVAESGEFGIGVYGPDGAELYSFPGGAVLRDPARIAVRPNGDIGVIEGTRETIRIFSYRGEYKGDLPLERIGDKPSLGALAWDRAGNFFVADNSSAEVFVYSPDGRLKYRFGSRGADEGQFSSISDIAVGDDGLIYVLDARGLAVQVFDSQGNFLRGWGEHATGKEHFSLPSGIAVDSKGRVVVSDTLRHTVRVFSGRGTLLAVMGGGGTGFGQLAFPSDVAVDKNDRIIVTERTNSRVQIFEPARE